MGSVEQVEDNLATWSEDRPLNEQEFAALTEIGRNLFAKGTVPCTACHYCVSKCPQGLDIPRLLRLYNEAVYSGVPAVSGTIKEISPDKQPGACISCHSCAAVCPQNIEIPGDPGKVHGDAGDEGVKLRRTACPVAAGGGPRSWHWPIS